MPISILSYILYLISYIFFKFQFTSVLIKADNLNYNLSADIRFITTSPISALEMGEML